MKFRREARDKTQTKLEMGDILLVDADTLAVINRIVRFGRERFPDLRVTKVTSDFTGRKVTTQQTTFNAETYQKLRRVDPATLRDDVPRYIRAKEERQIIILEELTNLGQQLSR